MYKVMVREMINASIEYLPVSIVAACILFVLFYAIKVGKNNVSNTIVWFVFYIYIFQVICIAFLSRAPGSRDAVRLQLFEIFSEDIRARIYAIQNIIMFIPFGFMWPLLSKCTSFRGCIVAGLLSSIGIEVVQYFTKRGYTELDDILNNLLGTIIGYGVFFTVRIIAIRCRKIKKRRS